MGWGYDDTTTFFSIEELHVRARPMIPVRPGDRRDAIRAFIGRQLVHIGNLTRSAPNMDLWARLG